MGRPTRDLAHGVLYRARGPISTSDIASAIGVGVATVRTALGRLQREGLVERIGPGPGRQKRDNPATTKWLLKRETAHDPNA